jgi:alpha-1,6-mannosyltransferase
MSGDPGCPPDMTTIRPRRTFAGPAAGDDPGPALARMRVVGTAGALMAAGAALGAGPLPVPNPLFGLRVLGLPGRNVALAPAYARTGLVVLAWIGVARLLPARR